MRIVETHFHLDYLKSQSVEETLRLASEVGVEKFITIGVDPNNLDNAFNLAEGHDNLFCSQGIHPHDSKDATELEWTKIRERAKNPKMVAVGEIGLDYYYNHSPHDVQKVVFRKQLELAVELDKPVIIHSRDADEDMVTFLEEFGPKLKRKGVVHSFSSGLELAKKALEAGFYLGFNGMITFPKADNVREAVKLCPLDRLLVETDSPFLTPVPNRGKENAPHQLPHILSKMAELKNITVEEMAEIAWANSHQLFF